MKYIYTLLLLSLTISVSAQKIRFTDTSNSWLSYIEISGGYSGYGYDQCRLGADTLIFGNIYKPFPEGPYYSTYWIREDTLAGIVYYRTSVTDTIDRVLYNYNMGLGDSLTFYFYGVSVIDSVTNIDSMIINGVYHKMWFMTSKSYNDLIDIYRSYVVIEGIGCASGPGYPFYGTCFEYSEQLICFSQNGIPPVFTMPVQEGCSSYFSPFLNCTVLSTNATYKNPAFYSISPNPATDHIDITTNQGFGANASIYVYDMSGRCVYHIQPDAQQDTRTINTTAWSDGLYMVIVQNNTGIVKKEKVVVRR